MKSAERRSYFSYGQNTVREIMRDRAPEASFTCSARLDDFRWAIAPCGYATVVPATGRGVYGFLWCITKSDEYGLDLAEGVGVGGYVKRQRRVTTRCGKQIEALVYETPSRRIGRDPKPGYVEDVIASLSGDDFVPRTYLEDLSSWLR
jgi:hypothetical protein